MTWNRYAASKGHIDERFLSYAGFGGYFTNEKIKAIRRHHEWFRKYAKWARGGADGIKKISEENLGPALAMVTEVLKDTGFRVVAQQAVKKYDQKLKNVIGPLFQYSDWWPKWDKLTKLFFDGKEMGK